MDTHRDFALFARGDTKAISESEWDWLDSMLDLAEFHIEGHVPLLLSARLVLHLPKHQLDLADCADLAAVTPATKAKRQRAARSNSGNWSRIPPALNALHASGNRTPVSSGCGAIPRPGGVASSRTCSTSPPSRHTSPATRIRQASRSPKAAVLWVERGLKWQPWKMAAGDLAALAVRKPVNAADRFHLATLTQGPTLPTPLDKLARWMMEHGEKGEQEGFM